MSPRRFNGWEPVETHTLHYDGQGRVTSVTVTREPEWDEQQQALVEAEQSILDSTCQTCGNDYQDTLVDPAEVGAIRWFVDESSVCHACAAVEARQRHMHDAHKDDHKNAPHPDMPLWMDGRIFHARPATPDEIAAAEGGAG